ncbi:MAG: PAS domain S-box protein [Methanoregula sp.]
MISILYVDDEPGLLEIGKLFLERSGEFRVDTILSAPAALDLLESKNYDAIISDYQMPEMDGIEFLKTVRTSGNKIPFVLFTGRGREEIVIQALNEGADFYLQKGGEPLSQFTELAHQVRQAVQQRQAEAGIRYLERREADIINFLPDATFAIDKKGVVISWNQAMEDLTGVSSSEVLGKDQYEYAYALYRKRRPMLIDSILAPDAQFNKEQYLFVRHDNKTVTGESTFKKPDGTMVYLWGKASRLFDENGDLAGAIESIRDISERRRKETELQKAYEQISATDKELRSQFEELTQSQRKIRDHEEHFQELVETAPDAIYISIGERFAYVNPAMIRMMGASSADQLLGMSLYDRIHPTFHKAIQERAQEILNEHKPAGLLETVYLKMDGTPINIESAVATFHYHNKFAALVILHDITHHKKAEQQLRERLELYRRIVETTDEAIAQMNENLEIVYVNQKMAELHGCTPEEMIGQNITSFMVAEDIPENTARIKKRGQNKSIQYKRRYVTKDGQIRWMHVSATPLIDPDDTFRGSFTMCYDSTDRKIAGTEIAGRNKELHEAYEQLTVTEEKLRRNFDELAKSQKHLEESERRYRNVVEDQNEFISRFLPDGTHVFVNEAYCRYFNLKRDEILGHRFRPQIPVEDQEHVKQFFASLSPENPIAIIEHRIIMPDGTLRWQRWSDRAIFDTSGNVIEYQSVGRDITDEMATKAALQESETRFREQYQNNPLAIFTWQHRDDDFVLVDCNKAAKSLTGGKSKDFLGISASTLYADRPEVLSDIWNCFYQRAVISKDTISKNFMPGRHIHVNAAFIPPDLIMVHINDITERWLAEKALADNKRMLDTLLHNLPGMVYRCRNDPDWTMEFVSEGAKSLTGYDAGDLIDNRVVSFGSLIVTEDRQRVNEEVQKGIGRGHPYQVEYRITDKAGRIRWVWEQGRGVFNTQNKLVALEGYCVDNSERKQATETLSQANKKLNLLSSITRHDINNQLLALNGFIDLLHEKTTDPALDYYFTWIMQSTGRISSMIRFTKEYEAVGINAPAWQDLHTVVNTAAQQAPLGKIIIKNDLPAGSEVFADPLIVKVFYNLIDNAVRYGGKITTIRFFLENRNGDQILVCEDDGLGIPYTDKNQIFVRGFGKNTGLGLFLSSEILSITGIPLTETGEPGKGARFEMKLPPGIFRFSGRT